MPNALRPVVFLDRDGTLNEEVGYIRDIDKLVLIPGAAEAVKRLNLQGVAAVLVTNQSGAARGYYGEEHIQALNCRLVELLLKQGAFLDAVYYCPHHPEASVSSLKQECNCRKPKAGMVERTFQEHLDLDCRQSYVVGDKATDVELAQECGAKAVLVTTGYGKAVLEGTYQWKVKPDYTAPDISAAIDWILTDLNTGLPCP